MISPLLRLTAFGALALVAAASFGACEETAPPVTPIVCGPSNCTGCCAADQLTSASALVRSDRVELSQVVTGTCHPGDQAPNFGRGGAACSTTPPNTGADAGSAAAAFAACTARCTGCCQSDGGCVIGASGSACGRGGESCEVCFPQQSCFGSLAVTDGLCREVGGCNGCRDATGACVDGGTNAQCGQDGVTCAACLNGTSCDFGGNCTGSTSCPGCVDAMGRCLPGNAKGNCGSDGGTCDYCEDDAVCSTNACRFPDGGLQDAG